MFALLVVAFWVFQVAQHQKFKEIAENNHQRRLPLPAPRGVLFDRNGKVLVENQNTINIALVREQSGNIDRTLSLLAAATGADEAQMREKVNLRRREPSYRPIVLIENASFAQLAAFKARRLELPGIIERSGAGTPVPVERSRGAPVRLRQRGQRKRPHAAGVRGRGTRVDGRQGRRRTGLQQGC